MSSAPPRAHPLVRAGASAGAALAAAGVAALPFVRLSTTHVLATCIVALTAASLHVRHTAAQISTRAVWLATGLLAAVNLLLGPAQERIASALILGGATTATLLLGRAGLARGERGAFEPSRYRLPLLVTLGLSTANALGFALYGAAILEVWGVVTENLIFAGGLVLGLFGLWRMRTWGVLVLGAMHAWAAGVELLGHPALPPVMKRIYGVSALAALVGLAPLLAIFVRKALRDEPVRAAVRVRVASVEPSPALSAEVTRERAAEVTRERAAEVEAEASEARRPARGTA